MSIPINYGGPAFPHSSQPLDAQGNPLCGEHSEWGMTLRDYFAAKAMVGMLSSNDTDARNLVANSVAQSHLAQVGYAIADAMLAARKEVTK